MLAVRGRNPSCHVSSKRQEYQLSCSSKRQEYQMSCQQQEVGILAVMSAVRGILAVMSAVRGRNSSCHVSSKRYEYQLSCQHQEHQHSLNNKDCCWNYIIQAGVLGVAQVYTIIHSHSSSHPLPALIQSGFSHVFVVYSEPI